MAADPLAKVLAESRSPLSAAEARALAAAVQAAPFAPAKDEWIDRVVPGAAPPLREALAALRTEAASADNGLAAASREGARRVAALRAQLTARGVDGFLLPRTDEHLGEYVAVRALRLQWLSGYSGSNGVGIVLKERAAILVDGRYTAQLRGQVDLAVFEPVLSDATPLAAWIAENLPAGTRLGYDPWLHAPAEIARLTQACRQAGGDMVPVSPNPIDALWPDQPPEPLGAVRAHDLRYAGKSSADKRQEIGRTMKADAAVITAAESVAWLLNVRGADVAYLPLPLTRAVLHADGHVDWFVDRRKLVPGLELHLGNGVTIQPPDAMGDVLDALGARRAKVRACPETTPAAVHQRLAAAGAELRPGPDPCAMPRACKNAAEVDGARAAQARDGVALTRFLKWMADEAPKGTLTEMDAADRLLALRREMPLFQDRSINTISSTGPNGAIIHYRVSAASNRRIEPGALYLVDSGGQYLDGTTDVTRTIAVGAPSEEQRHRFTLVLKGHIALAMLRFPQGTTGTHIDGFARQFLWREGLDFGHGTGHGVGSYLGVHEGPQRIAKYLNATPLMPGMICSNEPGYYKVGAYGLRFENLVVVQPCLELPDAEQPMLCFETLTLAPIDRALIETAILNGAEIGWIDEYHARVRAAVLPHADPAIASWLERETRPLGASAA